MLLLRKVRLTAEPIVTVLPGCIRRYRELYPWVKLDGNELQDRIRKRVVQASEKGFLFENPKQPDQIIAYAKERDHDMWYVLAENEEDEGGNYVVVTVLVHKDNWFEEELTEVQEARHG